MAAFWSGDPVGAIVADIGHYATKIGWAGDDYPRSYFRSNVAILRDEETVDDEDAMDVSDVAAASTTTTTRTTPSSAKDPQRQQQHTQQLRSSTSSSSFSKRRSIRQIQYDYYTRPLVSSSSSTNNSTTTPSDGGWKVANPVHMETGLWYDQEEEEGQAATTSLADTAATIDHRSGSDWYELLPAMIRHGYTSALQPGIVSHHHPNNNSNHNRYTVEDIDMPIPNPLLLLERAYNPPPIRQQVLECLMEELQVPAAFLCKDAAAMCFGCGRTTAIVVDVGSSGTTVTPVYEGFCEINKGLRRCPAGTVAMDRVMLNTLDMLWQQHNIKLSNTASGRHVLPLYQVKQPQWHRADTIYQAARLQIAQECRELGSGPAIDHAASATTAIQAAAQAAASMGGLGPVAQAAAAVAAAQQAAANGGGGNGTGGAATAAGTTFHAPHKAFVLPDGTVLDIPSANRFAVANLVFGSDGESIQKRHELVQIHQAHIRELINHATGNNNSNKKNQYASTKNRGRNDDDGDDDDDDNNNDPEHRMGSTLLNSNKRRQDDKYSEDAAIGLLQRRDRRSAAGGRSTTSRTATTTTTPTSGLVQVDGKPITNKRPKPPPFSNRHLQKACAKYLQAHVDDQLTASPVAAMICEAAYRCEREQQAALLGNVVLGGGGSCLGPMESSVPDYLREQVEAMIHTHTPGWRVKVLSPGFSERSILAWLGGSILGSLGSFHDMWITRAEYEEWGTAIVNRKCP